MVQIIIISGLGLLNLAFVTFTLIHSFEGAFALFYVHSCDASAETDQLCENLASLTCDISIKEKLVEELEASQKRLHAMKQQYEDKLMSLQSRIKETEIERDKVLATMG